MKVIPVGSNQVEVFINKDLTIFTSYGVPVAAEIENRLYCTTKKWSRTTSGHINTWLGSVPVEYKPQDFFDNLLNPNTSILEQKVEGLQNCLYNMAEALSNKDLTPSRKIARALEYYADIMTKVVYYK